MFRSLEISLTSLAVRYFLLLSCKRSDSRPKCTSHEMFVFISSTIFCEASSTQRRIQQRVIYVKFLSKI
jgi:hypothetical protein